MYKSEPEQYVWCAVKGTVVRSEYRSRDGGAAEGSVTVTAYASEPRALAPLLPAERPARLHGLAAISTTKRFGGDTGATLSDVYTVSSLNTNNTNEHP